MLASAEAAIVKSDWKAASDELEERSSVHPTLVLRGAW